MESQNENKILDVISRLETKVDSGFSEIHQRFDKVDQRFEYMDERFGRIDTRFDGMDQRMDKSETDIMEAIHDLADVVQGLSDRLDRAETDIRSIRSQMVTKDYLDRKIDDLRGELVALSRKVNTKLSVLVEQLVIEGSIKRQIADKLLALEPFPVA
jgi:predicted  nucleic acid-binding Zn-ribbon protein